MKKGLVILIMAFLSLFPFDANSGVGAVVAKNPKPDIVETRELDEKAKILASYLASHNSPMQYHAQDFIDAAEAYNLHWTLLPSIAGVESTFGKHIPGGYNAYGWAIYNSSSRFGFKSWRDGMFTVAKGLREGYLNKGLTDPYSINRVYATSPHWGRNVTFFMSDLEKFAANYGSSEKELTWAINSNIAAASGQLNFR